MGQCDVCGNEGTTETVSSGIAPISAALCSKCVNQRAEILGVVLFWVSTYGGPDKCPEFAQKIISYSDGRYIRWEAIRLEYTQNEIEILKNYEGDFVLEDDDQV